MEECISKSQKMLNIFGVRLKRPMILRTYRSQKLGLISQKLGLFRPMEQKRTKTGVSKKAKKGNNFN